MPPLVKAAGLPDGYRTNMHRPMHWETHDQFTPPGSSAGAKFAAGSNHYHAKKGSKSFSALMQLEAERKGGTGPAFKEHWILRLADNDKDTRPSSTPAGWRGEGFGPPKPPKQTASRLALDSRGGDAFQRSSAAGASLPLSRGGCGSSSRPCSVLSYSESRPPPGSAAPQTEVVGATPPATGESRQGSAAPPSSAFTVRLNPILGRLVQDHTELQQLKGVLEHVQKDQNRLNKQSSELKKRARALRDQAGLVWGGADDNTSASVAPKQDYESGYRKVFSDEVRHQLARTMRPQIGALSMTELKQKAYNEGPDCRLTSPRRNARRRMLPNERMRFD